MEFQQIESQCRTKAEELLQYYFGNLVKEAAIEQPETIGDYSLDLPKQIEAEYYEYLKTLWTEIAPQGSPSFEEIMNKKRLSDLVTEDDREIIPPAYHEAIHRSWWERITQTNHKDVTFYKGLLKLALTIRFGASAWTRNKPLKVLLSSGRVRTCWVAP